MPSRYKIITAGLCIALALVFTLEECAYSQDSTRAQELARQLAQKKKMEQEENLILAQGRTERGIYFFKQGEYAKAMQEFRRALEIMPNYPEAQEYLNKSIEKVRDEAKGHYQDGVEYYNKGKMQEAVAELSQIPEGYPYYEQAQPYLESAEDILEGGKIYGIEHPMVGEAHVEEQISEMDRQEDVIKMRKKAQEQQMMMAVEEAYLPPQPYKEEEAEAELTPEEIEDQKKEAAQQKLVDKMNENIVPALSLSDADIRDVIRELVKLTGVNIILDEGALKKLSGQEPITVSFTTVTPMPLLDLLDITLKTTNLAYKVEPAYIWISDKATISEEKMVVRTYKLKYGVRSTRDVELTQFGAGEEMEDEFEDF